MKKKILSMLFVYIYIYTVAIIPSAWALSDSTSFNPQPVIVSASNNSVPTGTVMIWTQEEIPEGWLECNGQPINPNFALYKIMTKTPDYRNIFLQGANGNLGKKVEAGLPNIEGYIGEVLHGGSAPGGENDVQNDAIERKASSPNRNYATVSSYTSHFVKFDASLSNPLYGRSNTVQPPAITVKYIIKAE